MSTGWGKRIDEANAEAVRRMTSARPAWVGVRPAREVASGIGERHVLHAGPPVGWERMSGAQKGAVTAAVLFEGWAASPDEARALVARGEVSLAPNHEHGGVGPMAGVVSPSMPVFVVEERGTGQLVYAALEEPRMNFGAFDDEALALRRFWRDELAPALGAAVERIGGLELGPIIAKGLHRGDELHNRPAASTSLMLLEILPGLLRSGLEREAIVRVVEYVHADEIFFLSLSMGYAKACADRARDVEHSTVVTCMARNGTDFGLRVSGLGDRWFTAPSPIADGLLLPGYVDADRGRDMGDSAITEVVGLGGFVLPAAPAIFEMLGARAERASAMAREMRSITVGRHPSFTIPLFDFAPVPVGIDVRRVVETGVRPLIDTAIAHREPGHPIIGAGLTRPPLELFVDALEAFARERGIQ